MNLYSFHKKPTSLLHHDMLITTVKQKEIDIFWKDINEYRKIGSGENVIANSARFSYLYAKNVLRSKFPAGEAEIAKDSTFAKLYATVVLKVKFEQGEDAIGEDMMNAMEYARLIDGKFEKGENVIAKNALKSWIYATKILKDRFEKGEPTMKDTNFWKKYVDGMAELGVNI